MENYHIVLNRVIEIPVDRKNPEGKTYREIAAQLSDRLPVGDHDIREIGYSKKLQCKTYWGYVPYWRLRSRLSAIVGADGWRFEIVSTYLNGEGNPIFVGVLNVLGVEKQGFGYCQASGGYTGSREEVAYADCFKNCAEMHGLGAYLDDQLELARYLMSGSLSGEAKDREIASKARLLVSQFQKEGLLMEIELKTGSNPKPQKPDPASTPAQKAEQKKAQTKAQPQYLYPRHNSEMKVLRTRLGLTVEELMQKTSNLVPGDMPTEIFEDLCKELAVDWAVRNEKFGSADVAIAALEGVLQLKDQPFLESLHAWLDALEGDLIEV